MKDNDPKYCSYIAKQFYNDSGGTFLPNLQM